MSRVFVCSPLRSKLRDGVEKNIARARFYCQYVVAAGHRPFAPHLFYPQFLDDDDPADRERGIAFGIDDLAQCDEIWSFGFPTQGMEQELKAAELFGMPIRLFTAECMPINPTN